MRTSRAGRSRVAQGGLGKYQLDVTALDVADAARAAGGWLFDRAMAGWDVTVTTGARTRDDVLRALKRGFTEVTLWGDSWQAGPDSGAKPVEHVLGGYSGLMPSAASSLAQR